LLRSFVLCSSLEIIVSEFLSADMTRALVLVINSVEDQRSYVQKLFGDPDEYAYKFANDTFTHSLPIMMNAIFFPRYGFLHSLTIDYDRHLVYFSNNLDQRLENGLFIYTNKTHTYYHALPETNEVKTY